MSNPPIACYVRGTEPELVLKDIQQCLNFCAVQLGEDWITKEVAEQAVKDITPGESKPVQIHPDAPGRITPIIIQYDVQGGRQAGLEALLSGIAEEPGIHDDIVTVSAGRLIDDPPDIDIIQTLVEKYSVSLHLCGQGVSLHASTEMSDAVLKTLSLLSDHGEHDGVEPSKGHIGRPPIGYTSEAGQLIPKGQEFERICQILQRVQKDEDDMSVRRAANLIGCQRQTVRAALDRPELYNLQ